MVCVWVVSVPVTASSGARDSKFEITGVAGYIFM